MALKSVPIQQQHYHLPEKTRLALIRETSSKPGASIPRRRLAVVHRQRQRFVQLNGNDGLAITD